MRLFVNSGRGSFDAIAFCLSVGRVSTAPACEVRVRLFQNRQWLILLLDTLRACVVRNIVSAMTISVLFTHLKI